MRDEKPEIDFKEACKIFNDAFDKEIALHDFPVLDFDDEDFDDEICIDSDE